MLEKNHSIIQIWYFSSRWFGLLSQREYPALISGISY